MKIKAGGYMMKPAGVMFDGAVGVTGIADVTGLMVGTEAETSPDAEVRVVVLLFSNSTASLFMPLDLDAAVKVHQALGDAIQKAARAATPTGAIQ